MDTNILIPMQVGFRLSDGAFCKMWEFVASGGYFNEESLRKHNPYHTSLIAIARVPVGAINCGLHNHEGYYHFIRDGLHRCCVAHLYRGMLREDEYFQEEHTLEDFEQVNLDCGWVTPLNPITEVRLADFHHYKKSLMAAVRLGAHETSIRNMIAGSKKLYCAERIDSTSRLSSMANDLWINVLQDQYGRVA